MSDANSEKLSDGNELICTALHKVMKILIAKDHSNNKLFVNIK